MMMKAIVVQFLLSAIACTTLGAPATGIEDANSVDKAIDRSRLVSSRNRRDLSPGMKFVAKL